MPELVARVFGRHVHAVHALPSDRDQNFRLDTDAGRCVLKICAHGERAAVLQQQDDALRRLAERAPELACPRRIPTRAGAAFATVDVAGRAHIARLVSFVEGTPLVEVRPQGHDLWLSLGALVARVDAAIADVTTVPPGPAFAWDLRRAAEEVEARLQAIADPARRRLVVDAIAAFTALRPVWSQLPIVALHNDANDHNVLVGPLVPGRDALRQRRAIGLIDFGDMVAGPRVFGLAIAAAYATLGQPGPIGVALTVAGGYHGVAPLSEAELACLWPALRARLAVSVCVAAQQRAAEPDNAYLAVSEAPAWATLERTAQLPSTLAEAAIRSACGYEPCAASPRVMAYLRHVDPAPLLGAAWQSAPTRVIDWSPASSDVVVPRDAASTRELAARVAATLGEPPALGFGRYDEPRLVYATPAFAQGGEPRTVHLGLDLFAPAGTSVHAPLDGVVEGVGHNGAPLDYGPTVLLRHACADGTPFWTLYGHLGAGSVAGLAPGARVPRGQPFAALGAPEENGGWAPHLHFQIVVDRFGNTTDYPGVCSFGQRGLWLSLCPDPNLLARLPGETRFAWPDEPALRAERRAHLGFNLSLSYARSLHIVRGERQYLYDAAGLDYLDAVNNVPHVGHAHPRVVAAAARQKGVLETNTRYLHEAIVRLSARLRSKLPPSLSVCFFVNSGSEANELALRLVRTATKRRDVVALEHGYHGNTGALVELSHYKFGRKGGFPRVEWVHLAACPDDYRARLRGDPRAGEKLAESVRIACVRAAERGGTAGFLHETLPGCGGQVVPPPGYLAAAYAHVRAAGGLCIADEVQTGLGRVGRAYWSFELQGVVPDVVTIGKPFGNGHPVAAVVTTEAVARSFVTGMEYFNTFGGNPASCAIAGAVLDVIDDEGLQARALEVGAHLRIGLESLQNEFALLGDVRGEGLYLGVELVTDRDSLAPATAQAGYVAERLRDHRILVSTDGPLDNVLKIKPPLCFGRDDADRLVATLAGVLREDGAHA
jgi:4-aminobutyrate aminotransferase-like enzyme/Ser/Thr protein kinase RdoA (MazF antagonist)